jgi:GNAT superfamily N-acetyltransferase
MAVSLGEKQKPKEIMITTCLDDNTPVLMRLLRPNSLDRARYLAGYQRLSERSRYCRFLYNPRSLSEKMIRYFTVVDNYNHLALCAKDLRNGNGIGVARYIRKPDNPTVAELAITVIDDYQNMGLGSQLMDQIIPLAKQNGIHKFVGHLLEDNHAMLKILRRFNASIHWEQGPIFRTQLDLNDAPLIHIL